MSKTTKELKMICVDCAKERNLLWNGCEYRLTWFGPCHFCGNVRTVTFKEHWELLGESIGQLKVEKE